MPTWWSELPSRRALEVTADLATAIWVIVWIRIGWWLYGLLARFASTGAMVQAAGTGLEGAGQRVAAVLARVPMIGQPAADQVTVAFAATASPFIAIGSDLEHFMILVTTLLVLIVTAVPLVIWLQRFLPWRLKRLRTFRAAHRAIRVVPSLKSAEIERLLAARAINRLPYEELLRHSPDPLGDWMAGRYERLAQAELASVGLRPLRGGGPSGAFGV